MYKAMAAVLALLSFPATAAPGTERHEPPGGTRPQLSPNRRLRHFRFSPDGKYVLAQDDSSVAILTVQPFAVQFRVPAENATLADFSPDSQEILFVSSVTRAEADRLALVRSLPHVERWSVAQRKRVEFTEIRSQPCGTLKLSPNGGVLGCVDFSGTLRFIEVASGKVILEKKGLCRPWVTWGPDENRIFTRRESGDLGSAGIDFSLDGRFVLAAPGFAYGSPFGWDFVERRAMRLRGELRRQFTGDAFVFVAPDEVVIRPMFRGPTSTLVALPSGNILSKLILPRGGVSRAADPGFVIVRFCDTCPAVAIEYGTGQLITTKSPVLDVLGSHYVTERANGELGLYERGKAAAVATVRLDAP
jgi:hypothetical protein